VRVGENNTTSAFGLVALMKRMASATGIPGVLMSIKTMPGEQAHALSTARQVE